MLKIQSWLKANNGQFDLLEKQLGIKSTFHPDDDRVILNYCQIDSPKQHEIVRECRGLVLNKRNYDIIARSFERFFNAGEMLDLHTQFVWEGCEATDKEDGSLILTYINNNEPHLNTRGSFGNGSVGSVDLTWRQIFNIAVPNWVEAQRQVPHSTLVWELCSRYNKIVRDYEKPTAYLLSAFSNLGDYSEYGYSELAGFCSTYNIKRPANYTFSCLDDVMSHVSSISGNDPTYEGLVIRDVNGLRMKVKSDKYCALHRLHNNGNVAHPKNIIPLILDGETDEVITYFKELEPTIRSYEARLNELKKQVENIWYCHHDQVKDRLFAAEALTSPLSSLLFKARKNGGHPLDYLKDSKELIIKVLS